MKFGSTLQTAIADIEQKKWFISENAVFMSYWYTSLFVVIEGYKELKLNDPVVDALLDSELVELLKLYRNGTAHYQKDYFCSKFSNFIATPDSAIWATNLYNALGKFLLAEIKRRELQFQEQMSSNT